MWVGIHIKTTGCLFSISRMSPLPHCAFEQPRDFTCFLVSAYSEGTGSLNHRVIQVQTRVEEDVCFWVPEMGPI